MIWLFLENYFILFLFETFSIILWVWYSYTSLVFFDGNHETYTMTNDIFVERFYFYSKILSPFSNDLRWESLFRRRVSLFILENEVMFDFEIYGTTLEKNLSRKNT